MIREMGSKVSSHLSSSSRARVILTRFFAILPFACQTCGLADVPAGCGYGETVVAVADCPEG